jgi:hypothetical protein
MPITHINLKHEGPSLAVSYLECDVWTEGHLHMLDRGVAKLCLSAHAYKGNC